MAQNGWPVSFSIGMVTFQALPKTVDEAVGAADALMYRVKRSGKRGVLHEVWPARRDEETGAQAQEGLTSAERQDVPLISV